MPEQQSTPGSTTNKQQAYDELVRKLADKVYEIWQRELRYEQERKGGKGR